jgi:hypothetical protein
VLAALYPIDKSVIKTYSLPAGQHDIWLDNIFYGLVPNQAFVGLVNNATYIRSFNRNPFNFHHYDLNYLCFCIKGLPIKVFNPDYEKKFYLEPYVSLFGNNFLKNEDIDITHRDFKRGYAIYRLTAREDNKSKWLLPDQGTVRLELKFSKPLPEAVTVLIYACLEGLISIDNQKKLYLSIKL